MPFDTFRADTAVSAAHAAFGWYRQATGAQRADFLDAIAAELGAVADELGALGATETGLGPDRLRGEIAQTRITLGLLAAWVREGRERVVVHDPADAEFPTGPRPDMRRVRIPVGVALNFAASNFPFAFSVAGVDSAAALAVGCPVVVKAHPGHPLTSRATAAAVQRASTRVFGEASAPLQLIEGDKEGIAALRDPRVAVATFTGSAAGGRLLASIAAARPRPIPFYGELGSINPVILTPGAIAARGEHLAGEYVAEVAFSGGQVCVKPGLLLVPQPHGLHDRIAAHAAAVAEHRLLYPGLGERYAERRDEVLSIPGAHAMHVGGIRRDGDGHVHASPTIVAMPYEVARAHAAVVAEEVFGPLSIVVEYDDVADATADLFTWVPGSLTVSIHLAGHERTALRDTVRGLQDHAGRIVVDEWPGAVYATPAQHHGGPWPATTLDTVEATSVGPTGLARFQRAVSWQNAPTDLLPPA